MSDRVGNQKSFPIGQCLDRGRGDSWQPRPGDVVTLYTLVSKKVYSPTMPPAGYTPYNPYCISGPEQALSPLCPPVLPNTYRLSGQTILRFSFLGPLYSFISLILRPCFLPSRPIPSSKVLVAERTRAHKKYQLSCPPRSSALCPAVKT